MGAFTIVNWGMEKIFNPNAPLSFMTTYRMSLISAGFISLDSTFKPPTI
jgi:hypothetical protein